MIAEEIRRRAQRILWFHLFVLVLATGPRPHGQAPLPGTCGSLPPGAVACWAANGDASDAIGSAAGQLQGGVSFAPGVSGEAFLFDGNNGTVMVPDNPALDFVTAFTLAAWVNPSGPMHDPVHGGIISKVGGGGGPNGYQFGLVGGNTLLATQFNAAGEAWPANQLLVNLPSAIPTGQWTHLATSYDGNVLKLFVNGQQVGALTVGPKTIANSSSSFRISGDDNNNVRFKGMIDEIVAFNRGLSEAEIQQLAQPPLTIAGPAILANAVVHQVINQPLTVSGGASPYTFGVIGTMPPGLELSAGGSIVGTTTAAGSYSFVVTVTDGLGNTADRSYAMSVIVPPVMPALTIESDGRLGVSSQYFPYDYLRYYINSDSAELYSQYSNFPWELIPTQPKRVISQPQGPDVVVFDFTSFTLPQNFRLTIVGSRPVVIATTEGATIAGAIDVWSNGGQGGESGEGPIGSGPPGSAPPGSVVNTGGLGGHGPGYVVTSLRTPWGWEVVTPGGGGGGGNASVGGGGWNGNAAVDTDGVPHQIGGAGGGGPQGGNVLQGGGGGGEGGGANAWYCCWDGGPGGDGGGALMIAAAQDLTIAPTGSIRADGANGGYYQGYGGGGGGGAGGYLLFIAGASWRNDGVVSAGGGAGSAFTDYSHGGGGAGGRIAVAAPAILNNGYINVAGAAGPQSGGIFSGGATSITGGGVVAGIGSRIAGATTGTGSGVTVPTAPDAAVTFPVVSAAGTTTAAPIDPFTAGPLPPSMTAIGMAYDITTTVSYSGPVTVCFSVTGVNDAAMFGRLRLLHGEDGVLVDRTVLNPDTPAPDFAARRICARVSSLSPFVLALVPELPHLWHASYRMEWEGPRTSGDQLPDANYQFFYTWRFDVHNTADPAVGSPMITVDTGIAGLTPNQPPNVALSPAYPPFVWTGPPLPAAAGFQTSLWSSLQVPTPYALGYDASKSLSGGPVAPGASESRTFTVSITPRDPLIRQAGITVDFAFFPGPGPHPVTASNPSCGSAHGTPQPLMGPGQLGVSITLGDEINMPLLQGETYQLACAVVLTNNASDPAWYSPGVTVSGLRLLEAIETTSGSTSLTTDPDADPADPLGHVNYEVVAPGQLLARLTKHFARTVHFDSANAIVDVAPPVTTASTQPLQPNGDNGWFRTGSVGVTLSASDGAGGSGVASTTYSLTGAQQQSLLVPGPAAAFGITAAGMTDVTFYATDNAGNVEAARTVTVKRDSLPPISQAAVSPLPMNGWIAGAASVTLTAGDLTSGVQRICAILSGAQAQPLSCVNGSTMTLAITSQGSTSVSYHAVDMAGNVEPPKPPMMVVVDAAAPVSTVSLPPPGPQGFYVDTVMVMLSASDSFGPPFSGVRRIRYLLNGVEQPSIMALSGSVTIAADGETTLTYWSEDRAGNVEAPKTATIVITRDQVPPAILVSGGGTFEATSPLGATVPFQVTAVDAVSGPRPVSCSIASLAGMVSIASPFTFPLGTTAVHCSASDAAGNVAEASFEVTVDDQTPPSVTVADVTATATVANGVAVDFEPAPAATDLVSGDLTPACSSTSGAIFPIGETVVTCTATDAAGNHGTATFTVTVHDGVPPTLSLPSTITATAYSIAGTPVSFVVTASDGEGAASFSCAPASGSIFPVGLTTVSCTAVDMHGNELDGAFSVNVTLADNRIGRFVAFSRDSTRLRANATVVRGDVGANEPQIGSHPHDADQDDVDDAVVRIGEGVRMQQAGSRVVGSTTLLANGSHVHDVTSNFLIQRPRAEVLGTLTGTMTVPYLTLPVFPTVTPGDSVQTVPRNQTLVLAAGSYGAITIKQGATLVLTGGLYQLHSLELDQSATIVFKAATELRIKSEVHTAAKARMILDANVPGLRASRMLIYVAGDDTSCIHGADQDEDGDNAGRTVVHLGQKNVIQANVYALNGTVWLKSRTTATGSFIGQHVRVGQNVTMTLDSAWQ